MLRYTAVPSRPNEQDQFILVDPFLFIIIIVPYKAAVLPVLRNRTVPQNLPVLILRIEIKEKDPARIQIIIDQAEHLLQLLFLQNIVDRVTDADHRPNRAVQLELPHILQKIQDVVPGFLPLFHCRVQHFLRAVHTDHVIPIPGEQLRHSACPAAKL